MKDPLFDNLAERFAGHEMDVDPGMWSAISGKLAAASESGLSELLQKKFNGHEAPVNPQVWTNISSQLGHGAAAGVGSTTGWWAAGIAATLVAGGFLLYNLTGEADQAANTPVAAQVAPDQQPAAKDPLAVVIPSNDATEGAIAGPTKTVLVPENQDNRTAGKAKQAATTKSQNTVNNANEEVPQLDPKHADPTPEGQQTVSTVLQEVVDNYVTSPIVVAKENRIPPPTQDEMPSPAVRLQHDEAVENDPEPAEPVLPEVVEAPSMALMIPTAFSPNGDGVNDELAVSVQHYQKATVRIFSATSNELVFSADNLETTWNGRKMNTGPTCEPGMYFYALEVTDEARRTWSKGEVVRLFR